VCRGQPFKEFVKLARRRGIADAEIVAVDCRSIPGESLVKDLLSQTRPRKGWKSWEARRLRFVDTRIDELLGGNVAQDECDSKRVVFKSFWSWQGVDTVRMMRAKRLKASIEAKGLAGTSSGSVSGGDDDELADFLEAEELLFRDSAGDGGSNRLPRWWAAARRGASGSISPSSEGCVIM